VKKTQLHKLTFDVIVSGTIIIINIGVADGASSACAIIIITDEDNVARRSYNERKSKIMLCLFFPNTK
jgi:hypothetical protein